MNGLEDFRDYTEHALSSLKADEALKHRIIASAIQKSSGQKSRLRFSPLPVLCTVLVMLSLGIAAISGLKTVPSDHPGEINVFSVGQSIETDSPDSSMIADSSAPVSVDLGIRHSIELLRGMIQKK